MAAGEAKICPKDFRDFQFPVLRHKYCRSSLLFVCLRHRLKTTQGYSMGYFLFIYFFFLWPSHNTKNTEQLCLPTKLKCEISKVELFLADMINCWPAALGKSGLKDPLSILFMSICEPRLWVNAPSLTLTPQVEANEIEFWLSSSGVDYTSKITGKSLF